MRPVATATAGLRGHVIRGVGWVAVAQIAIRLLGFATTVVLVRRLGPHNVGLAAEALVFTRLAFLFSDVGLRAVLVERRTLSDVDKSTAFWTSAATGLVVSLAVVGLAGPIADLFGNSEVGPLVAFLSLYIFFTALGVTPGGLLARELRFRTLELRSVGAAFAGAVAAIAVAVATGSPWAIVTQIVVDAAVSTALLWIKVGWRPRFMYSRQSLRGLAGFGSYVFGAGLFSYLHRNADNFLVGRFLGPAKLGAYSAAYDTMQWPMLALSAPIWNVFFPAMTRMRDDPRRIGAVWIRVTRIAVAITAPSFLGMVVIAPDFVTVVFGPSWHDTIPVLQILSYVGLVQSLTILVANVLLTLDRARTFFRLTAVGSVTMVGAFALGLHWGLLGVTTTYAIANTPVSACFVYFAAKAVRMRSREFLRAMRGVLVAAATMAVAVLAARIALVAVGVSAGPRLVILVVLGVVVYLPLCARCAGDVVVEIVGILKHRTLAPAPAEPPQ